MQKEGILTVTIQEGKLTRDTEFMGKMSPYCTMTYKGQKFKTAIHYDGGKKPKWGEEATDTYVLEVTDPTDELVLRCWDQDLTTSDAIGFTKVKVSSLMCVESDWFTIMFDNKPAGEIMIGSKFEPKGGDQYAALEAQMGEQSQKLQQEADAAKAQVAQLQAQQQQMSQQLQQKSQQDQQKQQMMAQELWKAQQSAGQQSAEYQKLIQEKAQQEQSQANEVAALKAQLQAAKTQQNSLQDINGAGYASPAPGGYPQMGQPGMGQGQQPGMQQMQPPMGGMPPQQMMGGMQQPGYPPQQQQPMYGQQPGMMGQQAQMGYQQPGYGQQMPPQQYGQPGFQQPQMMGGYQQPGMMQQQPGMMMGQQPPQYGMPPQQQQPMMGGYPGQQPPMGMQGGFQQPGMMPQQQQGPKCYCDAGHPCQYTNRNPYGVNAVPCNTCKQDINFALYFHHCQPCLSDYCQNCSRSRQEVE